ncbi:MAG: hypothetical protein Q9161_003569 [Pseudevernia consocians]
MTFFIPPILTTSIWRKVWRVQVCFFSGFVVKPTLMLLGDKGVEVTVGTNIDRRFLLNGKMLIAISLIPYTYYALVIKSTIRKKSSVVTISYISPSMEELEKEIDEAGITVMNEIGLDQDTDEEHRVLAGLRWTGLFSDGAIIPRSTPLDTLCATLGKKMAYEEGERDLVFLQNKFEFQHADGKHEMRTSTLCEYGDPKGYSAMAKPVDTPYGVIVMQVSEGKLPKGLLAPYTPEICDPLREELRGVGN